MQINLKQILKYIINIFFPNVCGMCGKICKNDICPRCTYKLNQIKLCKKHIYLQKSFTTHMYIFKYDDCIKKSLINYKFHEQAYICKSFVNFILKDKKICRFIKKYDIIIPVPISKNRKIKRGYNQAGLIAKKLAIYNNVLYEDKVLYKIRNALPQSSLNKEQRKTNLQNAYMVKNEQLINGKKVLLLDDIYTTGSTLNECAKMLKKYGAYDIGALTLAKD